MADEVNARPILGNDVKTKIKEWYGIDVDSDVLSPMVDFIFKRIFIADGIRSETALIDLLNSVLEPTGAGEITKILVINPDIPVDVGKRKKAIFDIRVKLSDGRQAIVEMQLSGAQSFRKRAQFIISKAYSSQEITGENYDALQKCYLICIINFSLFKEPGGLVTEYRYRDKRGDDLTDDQTIIFLQLPEADKILDKPVEAMTDQEMWALFFRHMPDKRYREKLKAIAERKEGIRMAANVLFEVSQDEKARIQYENELIAELDTNSRIHEAREEGREEGIAIGEVRGMNTMLRVVDALKAQVPVDEIAAVYKMSHERIEQIRSALGL